MFVLGITFFYEQLLSWKARLLPGSTFVGRAFFYMFLNTYGCLHGVQSSRVGFWHRIFGWDEGSTYKKQL